MFRICKSLIFWSNVTIERLDFWKGTFEAKMLFYLYILTLVQKLPRKPSCFIYSNNLKSHQNKFFLTKSRKHSSMSQKIVTEASLTVTIFWTIKDDNLGTFPWSNLKLKSPVKLSNWEEKKRFFGQREPILWNKFNLWKKRTLFQTK